MDCISSSLPCNSNLSIVIPQAQWNLQFNISGYGYKSSACPKGCTCQVHANLKLSTSMLCVLAARSYIVTLLPSSFLAAGKIITLPGERVTLFENGRNELHNIIVIGCNCELSSSLLCLFVYQGMHVYHHVIPMVEMKMNVCMFYYHYH